MRILLTGVSGFAGAALLPRLLEQGHDVRALARDRDRVERALAYRGDDALADVSLADFELVIGDTLTGAGVLRAMRDVDVAYYLIHSMEPSASDPFPARERASAETFVDAARAAGVQRIVYLGGPLPDAQRDHPAQRAPQRVAPQRVAPERVAPQRVSPTDAPVRPQPSSRASRASRERVLESVPVATSTHGTSTHATSTHAASTHAASTHLSSRHEVERILLEGIPDSVALRASVVIGARSRSFRFLVRLVERLPVLTLPAWRRFRIQPIDERDVLEMLTACASHPSVSGRSLDVGGPDVLSYGQIVERIADLMLLGRPSIGLGVTVTPIAARLAAVLTNERPELVLPLMEGLTSDLLPTGEDPADILNVTLHSFDSAVEHALHEWEKVEPLAAR